MEIPKWKKWLSHIWELHIESAYSQYSEDLYVVLKRGRFQLCTSNAIYSFEDLYVNFSRSFDRLNIDKSAEMNVLVLGIGMGSIPMVMESHGFKKCHFTAIEIDDVVIDLLTRYGLDKIASPIEVYEADAISYVAISQESYDLIAIDLFINDIIPDNAQSTEFLNHIKAQLSDQGLLMMNHLSLTKVDREKGERFFNDVFKSVFPAADFIDVDGNWMLVNDKARIKS